MPECDLSVWRAPSMRGWMLAEPGVAMNSATSPDGTSCAIRLPISWPDTNRSWPMYDNLALLFASALEATTGIFALSAASVPELNAFSSTRAIAMPSAPPVTAVLNALTISLTLLFSDPVHWYEQPSSLHASSAPYFVGTKNGFVVTWFTNTNFRLPFEPKMPEAGVPLAWLVWAFVVDGELLPPHAAMIAVARPAPAPVRAVRRVIARQRASGVSCSLPSAHSRRSIASLANSDSWSGTVAPFPGQVGRSRRRGA